MGVVHAAESLLGRGITAALEMGVAMTKSLQFLQGLLRLSVQDLDIDTLVGVADSSGIQGSKFRMKVGSLEVTTSIEEHVKFCKKVLKMTERENLLVSNGKVYHNVCVYVGYRFL